MAGVTQVVHFVVLIKVIGLMSELNNSIADDENLDLI